jgi:PAS domain-containing protein
MKPARVSPGNGAPDRSSAYTAWKREKSRRHRFQALLESDCTAVYTCDVAGVINYYNTLAAELWGRSPEIGGFDERFCGSLRLFGIDGRLMTRDQSPMAEVLAGKLSDVFDAEMQILRPDGSCVIVIANIAPLVIDGFIVGAVNSFYEDPLRRRPHKRG